MRTSVVVWALVGFIALLNAHAALSVAFAADGALSAPSPLVSLWSMDTAEEVATYGDDGTGTRFALEQKVVMEGKASAAFIPSGVSLETKAALELCGERLSKWVGCNGDVGIDINLPLENRNNPTMFFLGLADVTDKWAWVGGVFSTSPLTTGWNRVTYPVSPMMTELDPSRKYRVFLAFAAFAGDVKTPMTEPIYVDGVYKENDPTKKDQAKAAPPEMQKEVEKLLKASDSKLLDTLSKKTFDYFWYEANPANGLVKDRSTKDSPCSVAAVGFGLSAIPIAVERGWITRDQGYRRALTTLRSFAEGVVPAENGFFYHFVDMSTGRRSAGSELSSIDTALFISGALTVGQYFAETEVYQLSRRLYERVDWKWMLNGGQTLAMGWRPESGFISARWDRFDESMVMYLLAIGSPTNPIPASAWDAISRPVVNGHIGLPDEVLFIYQYSHAWVDFRDKEDSYANYWSNSVAATKYNRDFCMSRASTYRGYGPEVWGISASDGPGGYRAYGASDGNHDGTIAPYAAVASLPFTPDLSMGALRGLLGRYGGLVWGKYGLVSAVNERYSWYSEQHIGIDQGDILLMVENYRSGLIWKLFMAIPEIGAAMSAVGFREST